MSGWSTRCDIVLREPFHAALAEVEQELWYAVYVGGYDDFASGLEVEHRVVGELDASCLFASLAVTEQRIRFTIVLFVTCTPWSEYTVLISWRRTLPCPLSVQQYLRERRY